jgi:heme exporter protein C
MVFNAYLLLRRFGGAGSEVLAAAVGFFGMALVPFIYWSVNLWRTIHPKTSVVPTLPTDMGIPLYFCWAAFTLLYVTLLLIRVRVERSRANLDDAYLALEG